LLFILPWLQHLAEYLKHPDLKTYNMLLSIFLIGDHNRKDTEDSHAANQSENENDSSNEKSNSNEDTNIKGSKYLNFRD
jgi:hypothetical protein